VSAPSTSQPSARVFRLPRTTYLVLLFLAVGVWPVALYGGETADGGYASPAALTPAIVLFLVPVLVAVYIARTATVVDADGITVRALFGERRLPWSTVRGISLTGTTVYAVLADGSVRLPCVRVADLAALSRASGGRLPEIAEAPAKHAPQPRRRR
jgi:hypothetical protein